MLARDTVYVLLFGYIMASINAKNGAIKVLERVRNGKLVVYKDIMQEVGYSKATSKIPEQMTKTKSYRNIITPVISKIDRDIDRMQNALGKKDMDKETVKVLVSSLDVLIKNHQLLSGGATDRKILVLPSEVIGRNIIEADYTERKDGSVEPLKP